MKLWIFDLDGTLTDSFPVFFDIMKKIFSRHGQPLTEAELHEALGSTMPEFFAARLGPERAPEALAWLRRESLERAPEVLPFPGIEACLTELRAKGREVAVWTARERHSADRILDASGLRRFVSHVVTGNCVVNAKPDPEGARIALGRTGFRASEAVMIGDHSHDVNAARAAGVLGVRASWNPYWRGETCAVADRQFFTVADFAGWIRSEVR